MIIPDEGNNTGVIVSHDIKFQHDIKAGFPLANFFARSDLFPLSASILPRLADVISDSDKGKRSLRAKKFASEKPA